MKRRNFLKLLGLSLIMPKIGLKALEKNENPYDDWDNTAWFTPNHNEDHLILQMEYPEQAVLSCEYIDNRLVFFGRLNDQKEKRS